MWLPAEKIPTLKELQETNNSPGEQADEPQTEQPSAATSNQQLKQLKQKYLAASAEIAPSTEEESVIAEETKESVRRFENLRQELSSSEFKNSLLNHHLIE